MREQGAPNQGPEGERMATTTLDRMVELARKDQEAAWAEMSDVERLRVIRIDFLARHTVCRYGTASPAKYALVREYKIDGSPERHPPVVGPLRSTKKSALEAGWAQYLSEGKK